MNRRFNPVWLLIMLVSLWSTGNWVSAGSPVVHAVLFYSRACPHCHKVMTEDLPPLVEQYGDQLSILVIDTVTQQGRDLFLAAAEYYQIPGEQLGVPLLVVEDTVLMGSLEIPQQFPGIVEDGLIAGGIDWPDFPGLGEILEAEGIIPSENPPPGAENSEQPPIDPTAEPGPSLDVRGEESAAPDEAQSGVTDSLEEAAQANESMTLAQRFGQDKAGNTLSVIVLLGMVLIVFRVGYLLKRPGRKSGRWPGWTVPVLVLVGTAVALYMSYVEITQTEAVCGPVGNCNTVQQSPYASLFGLIPIGVLGVLGYVAIGLAWLIMTYGPVDWRKVGTLALWLLAFIGTLFSVYLTLLEPFVIGASCAWCLSSAVVMSLLLWATTAPVAQAWFVNGAIDGSGKGYSERLL